MTFQFNESDTQNSRPVLRLPHQSDATLDAPLYDARRLTSFSNVAQIRLDDKIYTLRITRAGKLILTK